MKKQFPVKAVITFVVLVVAGAILSATAGNYLSGGDQIVVTTMGGAVVGGSLAFFLIEMFRWDRERNTER